MSAESIRKRIINKALQRKRKSALASSHSTNMLGTISPIEPVPLPRKSSESSIIPAKSKDPDLSKVENYISAVCERIESNLFLPAELAEQASDMGQILEDCLEELPDFSIDFYFLVSNVLRAIEGLNGSTDYRDLATHLMSLGQFMKEKPPLDEIEEGARQVSLKSLSVSIT